MPVHISSLSNMLLEPCILPYGCHICIRAVRKFSGDPMTLHTFVETLLTSSEDLESVHCSSEQSGPRPSGGSPDRRRTRNRLPPKHAHYRAYNARWTTWPSCPCLCAFSFRWKIFHVFERRPFVCMALEKLGWYGSNCISIFSYTYCSVLSAS
jgi:hypothetical protein